MAQTTAPVKRPAPARLDYCLQAYRRGRQPLFMLALPEHLAIGAGRRLVREAVDYHVQPVMPGRVNLFFGQTPCVELVRSMVCKPLYQLSHEEDFILGVLLGQDLRQQCLRWLVRRDQPEQGPMVVH